MLLLDLSHTSHTRARTGIQRVARTLQSALGSGALAVTHDPYLEAWRPLEPWEQTNLTAEAASEKRGTAWPLAARWRGRFRRVLSRPAALPPAEGIIVPEVFSSAVAAALPALFAATAGPRVAVFHDAIALKFPEFTPPKTVARFPPYLRELLRFDGIAANSEDSRASLADYWHWLGVPNPPPVAAIPLGVDLPDFHLMSESPPGPRPIVLSVGSIEGRKNHLALLEACERLWAGGTQFELRLVGLAHPQTGRVALERIHALQAAGRPLRYDGPLGDAAVNAAYAECTLTVYPSLIEGFGLPVLESLAHGRPCLCSAGGAIGESARGGGCVMLEEMEPANLATALGRLLATPAEVTALAAQARARTFKTGKHYAAELVTWLRTLSRRP